MKILLLLLTTVFSICTTESCQTIQSDCDSDFVKALYKCSKNMNNLTRFKESIVNITVEQEEGKFIIVASKGDNSSELLIELKKVLDCVSPMDFKESNFDIIYMHSNMDYSPEQESKKIQTFKSSNDIRKSTCNLFTLYSNRTN